MRFISTRGKSEVENASYAIVKGLADDGGLYVPETFPNLYKKIDDMLDMEYYERAATVIGGFLSEYDFEGLLSACKNAYSKFEENDAAPVVKIDDKLFILELFHGPTLAFKDIALTILPYLLRKGANGIGEKNEILILVATSGDTGKAALEGFKDQDGFKIMVLFPSEGVSDMQKLQMTTQEGNNVNVVAVKGNFDDCQNAVKKIFSDDKVYSELKDKGVVLSSANSINFGRLVPQIAYYFSAYCDLVNSGEIKKGEEIDFVVPTGNFGNILAGYYAKKMGLPVSKLVCASNSNNVLTEFFISGTYDKNREFFKTASPSMDILVSSNLERLLFELSERDCALTTKRMEELKKAGKYSISAKEKAEADSSFFARYCDDEDCYDTIAEYFDEYGYLSDTHTAVALNVERQYKEFCNGNKPTVVLSTASPYKFPQIVLKAISDRAVKDPFKASELLFFESAAPIPLQISSLLKKEVRFSKVVEKDEVENALFGFIEK